MKLKQLTSEQRYQISALLALNFSQTEIAKQLSVNRSTMSREIKRNSVEKVYSPEAANRLTQWRRQQAAKRCISKKAIDYIHFFLANTELYYSPIQISVELKLKGILVSHEWIYRYVAQDRLNGGKLYKGLRNQGRAYKKRTEKRGKIPNATSIECRPQVVDERCRIGDWEVDLVLGKQGTGALVTVVERKSRLYLVRKVLNKQAETVAKALKSMLKPYRNYVHTLTFDNDLEFAAHEKNSDWMPKPIFVTLIRLGNAVSMRILMGY